MVRLYIRVRGRRVRIRCVPVKKVVYERESEEGAVFDTVEHRYEAT
jgi:hypothetical protein